ncbi:MAG TPA: class I SAM-dependent methyltransferase [Methyloversatilis sp.]
MDNRARPRRGRYLITPPTSLDGTGKHYMGREISDVMGWQASAWLEREERESEERTDLLLQALDIRPGMVIADIGAGTGYLSRLMSPMVKPDGRILAVDVQPMMVRMLQRLTRLDGFDNIEPLRCLEHDVQLPPSTADMAIMLDVYHELACPHEMLGSIVRAVKPGGQVVFVEFKEEDPDIPIKPLHKMSEARVRREAAVHRLVWECTLDHLPWQHIVMFRKRT